jgi:DNA-binding transcriptional ArsR family regulator
MARKLKDSAEAGGDLATMPPEIPERAVQDLSQVFKLLSDETRLRILLNLAREGELHVTDLCERVNQDQPAVSHHLALLRVSGLIEARRAGKFNFYSLRADRFGELLVKLFSATGEMPRKIRFHNFHLTFSGTGTSSGAAPSTSGATSTR